MLYLFGQVWILFLIAFILGWIAHWLLCCRNKESDTTHVATSTLSAETQSPQATAVAPQPEKVVVNDAWKPQGFSSRPDSVDDLKRIKGVGNVIEQTLNELGIYQFQQIAEWDNDNVSWVENFLSFPGRVKREGWIDQAKTLTVGGTTEFSKRVDKGEMDY